jgi:hypothetical protein
VGGDRAKSDYFRFKKESRHSFFVGREEKPPSTYIPESDVNKSINRLKVSNDLCPACLDNDYDRECKFLLTSNSVLFNRVVNIIYSMRRGNV